MVHTASHSPSVCHSLFPFLHPNKSRPCWCPTPSSIFMDLLIYYLASGHLRYPWGHLGSFGCVSHVGKQAFQGFAFKDGLRADFGLDTAEMVQLCLGNPRIPRERAWCCFSYLQTQQCWLFSAGEGSTFLYVFHSTQHTFQMCGRHKVKEYSRLVR